MKTGLEARLNTQIVKYLEDKIGGSLIKKLKNKLDFGSIKVYNGEAKKMDYENAIKEMKDYSVFDVLPSSKQLELTEILKHNNQLTKEPKYSVPSNKNSALDNRSNKWKKRG